MRLAIKKYKKLYADSPLPDAGVTLNFYHHASYAHTAEQMAEFLQFRHSLETKRDRGLQLDKQLVFW